MKKQFFTIACLLLSIGTFSQSWSTSGVTVAGGNGAGSAANQLTSPTTIFVDASANVYVSDEGNHRIQKWVSPYVSGVTVAGSGVAGCLANQLSYPIGVWVDNSSNIYASDNCARVTKWTTSSSSSNVAGGNGNGSGANQLNSPHQIFIDNLGNIYIADDLNHRVQKWVPPYVTGLTVAGGNGAGSALNQLDGPVGVFVDASQNVYVSDYNNYRVMKWASGSSSGSVVAGGNGKGSAANQLNNANYIFVDNTGIVYVADFGNNRIQRWASPYSSGTTPVTGLNNPSGVWLDANNNIYVCEWTGNSVKRFDFIPNSVRNISSNIENLIIAPNPTENGKTNLSFNLLKDESISIDIIGLNGETISVVSNKKSIIGKQNFEIYTTNFANGIYQIIVSNGNSKISIPLTVSTN